MITVSILDAGADEGDARFRCEAKADTGESVSGSPSDTFETALARLNLLALDRTL
jgi:hypothetical protein